MTFISRILFLDNNRCRFKGCGKSSNLEVHHIIARSQGGEDVDWNGITLCNTHHSGITEGKISEVKMLESLKYKKDFRWGKALEWHKLREALKNHE